MDKFLIIPDVHGRDFWRYALEHANEYREIIFLGDYLDPYPHENISFDKAVSEFKDIIQFKKDNWNKVTLLLGNHDIHYAYSYCMNCSRLNFSRRKEMHDIYDENNNYFELIHISEGCLFSHAGVYDEWLHTCDLSLQDLMKQNVNLKALLHISDLRGGYNQTGSCIWADIRESEYYTPNTEFYQIVGHTQLVDKPYITDAIACLDVRRCFILDPKTKEIKEINNTEK